MYSNFMKQNGRYLLNFENVVIYKFSALSVANFANWEVGHKTGKTDQALFIYFLIGRQGREGSCYTYMLSTLDIVIIALYFLVICGIGIGSFFYNRWKDNKQAYFNKGSGDSGDVPNIFTLF